jgi:hypothetical protein
MAAKRPVTQPSEVQQNDAEPGDGAEIPATVDPALAAPDSSDADATSTSGTAEVEATPTATPAPAFQPQVVYVQAPKPFVKKGNRGFGILVAILSAVIYAALYAVALVLVEVVKGQSPDFSFVADVDAKDFWAPVVVFAIGFVLLVLIVNRAGWAAHVLGSIFVAAFVFFGGTGALLLLNAESVASNRVGEYFTKTLFSIALIIAALLAREVSLWMGAAIASRGRKLKARNVDARVLYDQEIAAKRAEYERANAAAATAPSVEVPVSAEAAPAAEASEDSVAP